MNRTVDLALGHTLNAMGRVALSSWTAYRALFTPPFHWARSWAPTARARAAFWNARDQVPAYREFLTEHDALTPNRFDEIPSMDKDNYIRRHSLAALCQGGRLPTRGAVIDESSGSSGTATNWVRGAAERRATRRLIQYSARATFGDQSFILLNAFALGPWATGMNVSMSMVDRSVLKSIGPDVSKVVASLKLLGPDHRYVLTGYPPFLKVLVDTANLDWTKYDVCAVVGGEGLSEALRASLNRCFRKTLSSYGASDLEINLAVESDFTIAVRQAATANPTLCETLFGGDAVPMIFQYDPLNYWIETDPQGDLLVTLNRIDNVSPRIRYNIHDRGRVSSVGEVLEALKSAGASLDDIPVPLDLPLLFHWGRQDTAVAFYGSKVTPEDIQNAILRAPALTAIAEHFAMHPYEDDDANKRLEFWIELTEGTAVPTETESGALSDQLIQELTAVNQDFRESIKMVPPERRPTIRWYPHDEGPLANQDVRIKRRYIL